MKDKTKTLPLSYREKKRYIAFEILSDEKLEFNEIIKAIWSGTINLLGILNVAKTNFKFISDIYDKEKQRFVVRCLPKDVEYVRLSMALITVINEKKVCIRSLGVTGTLKAVKIKFFED
jgi:ribonuclease P/MRP protein subunit POP5